MKYLFLVMAAIFVLSGCDSEKRGVKFWYPIKKLEVNCGCDIFEVYKMTHSTGWSGAPYIINAESGSKMELGMNCTATTIDEYQKHNMSGFRVNIHKLTEFQSKHVIHGF